MKKLSLLLLFAFALGSISYGQLGIASATYDLGDIETDKYFTYYSGTQSSDCPGLLTVTLPADALILYTDVSYDMTSDENSTISKQKSHFRCVSPGGINEATHTSGPNIYTPGTESYSRPGLDIANDVVGGGNVDFELHAGASYYKHWCTLDSVKVDNNTWTVTITYIPSGFSMQALNPTPVDGGVYVGLDDDLTWDFGADTDTYDVYFGTDNPPTTQVVFDELAGATGTYDPGTMNETETYYWQVVSKNTNGYTSGPVWSFTTVCGSFLTPFTEDFENVTIPELPYCWTKIVNSTSTAYLETNGYYGNFGPNCITMGNNNDAAATLIFISPQIDIGAGSLADKMVHLYVNGADYPYLNIGTMSDPTDESTFTSYETILVYQDYKEHDIYMNDYVGTDTYIAFKLDVSQSYQTAQIDDITIGDMPTCIRPEALSADNLTINSAMLHWTDLNGATSWNIEYDTAGFIPTGVPSISGVSNPHVITELNSATEYDFYVQTDCGGGDVSAWTSAATFVTPCDFYAIPFSENFDGVEWGEMPACWSSILFCADGFAWNGNQGGYFQMENSFDLNSTLMLISPPVLDIAPNRLKFNAQSNTVGAELLIGTMSNPADQNTFELLTSVTFTAANIYEPFDVWLNGYTGIDNYFVFKHSNGSTYLTIQIDDIEVEALPTCLPPSDIFVDEITTTTAKFNWTESGTATDWEIEIGNLGFTPGTGSYLNQYFYSNPLGIQSYDLTGLAAATVYDVYVRTDCGAGDFSPWTGPVTFQTSFDAFTSLPVTEDFESGMGITGNDYQNVENWVINTDLYHGGLNSIHNPYLINDDNVLFMLGTFDFTAKTDVMLTFWQIAKTDGNSDHCYVEISTDGGLTYDQLPESTYYGTGNYREAGLYTTDGPAFDEDSYADWGTGLEVPDNTWWKKEYFNLTDYNTFDNVVIRFRLWSNGYTSKAGWYIDDIAVEALGTPGFYVTPLSIEEDATASVPIVNTDLKMGNTGDFPSSFTANVVYDEIDMFSANFNSGMPVDWTIVNNGTNDVTWTDTTDIYNKNFDGTRFAWVDGLQAYLPPVTNTMDEQLISPSVNATAYASGTLQLEYDQVFDADYQPGDTARVYVYDGANWVMIYESWTDDGSMYSGGTHKVWNVSAYANDNFKVKFQYIEGSITARGRFFAIDNVRLRASMSALGWLTIDGFTAIGGVALPDADGLQTLLDVQMDATGLALGTYYSNIEVTSNDPLNPTTIIPCTLNVIPDSQEYTLDIGYKFISSRIIPENPDMMDVLVNILNENLDFVRNSSGLMLRKIGPNWVNNIGDWITTEGYLFKMVGEDVFSISGEVIDPQTPILLVEGYQFVSFLPENQIDALVAFNDVLDNLDFVRNTAGFTLIEIGPNWVNGIGDLNPGEGYLVKMNAEDILIYPVTAEKFTGIANIKPEYFNFEGGNAADPVYTMYVSGLEIGDEVAAYDGNLMVGAMKVISENVFDNSLAIFNTLTNGQGYQEGNLITLKVLSSGNIVSTDFTMEAMYDSYVSDVYPDNDGEFSVVNITKGVTLTGELLVYPNPATDEINISSPSDISNVTIINYVGQSVYSSKVNSSNVQINTNNFEAGIYIIRIQTCKGIKTKKIIIE